MRLDRFSQRSLGFWPTPLVALERLSDHFGSARLYMKRDDQSGLALGGNKSRKLEYLVGEALSQGCDSLVTAGAMQSNHCRQTAAAAAVARMECHLLVGGTAPEVWEGNLLLDRIFGARIQWRGEHRRGEDLEHFAASLRSGGHRPYVVPYGGSNAVGALGFVRAAEELSLQASNLGVEFTHLVFASSSGGTQAGLVVGSLGVGARHELIGIRIDKEECGPVPFRSRVLDLAREVAELVAVEDRIEAEHIRLDESRAGAGYGVVGDAEREAISLVARLEGILLDPVYTGRAMAGLIEMLRAGYFRPQDRVLFWHTGGSPAIFAYAAELT